MANESLHVESNAIDDWTFTYVSEDGNYHHITITAPSFKEALDQFENIIGEHISLINRL